MSFAYVSIWPVGAGTATQHRVSVGVGDGDGPRFSLCNVLQAASGCHPPRCGLCLLLSYPLYKHWLAPLPYH